jgi:flagellar biosynthetic protein FliQ
MSPEFVLGFSRQALTTAMLIAGPILAAGLLVGLTVALFQAVTQIHEISLTFIPKIGAMAIAAYLAAGWMMEQLLAFTRHAFTLVPGMGGG